MWRVSRAQRVSYEDLKSRMAPPELGPARVAPGFVDLTRSARRCHQDGSGPLMEELESWLQEQVNQKFVACAKQMSAPAERGGVCGRAN